MFVWMVHDGCIHVYSVCVYCESRNGNDSTRLALRVNNYYYHLVHIFICIIYRYICARRNFSYEIRHAVKSRRYRDNTFIAW